jgi:tRNA/rRNA methyltransferase
MAKDLRCAGSHSHFSLELAVMTTLNLDHIAIVLVEPQIPENIGAVARAMNNMGIRRLILVKPERCDLSRILRMATGTSIDIVEDMEVFEDLTEALASFHYVVGTTARIGAQRPSLTNPRDLAQELLPISQNNHVAVLFGPEDRGLSNEHLRPCHTIATIPTAQFASLNLAQAVMIVCYDLFLASRLPSEEPLPRLANKFELEGMYRQLSEALQLMDFLYKQNPELWMMSLRRYFSRIGLYSNEVRMIRGVCRQLKWFMNRYRPQQDPLRTPNAQG